MTSHHENLVKSTLIELPPDLEEDSLDDDGVADFIRANSVEELARESSIGNEEVLNRVLLPGKRFGAYHILGFVAAGGMGEIYAAQRLKEDGRRSRPVALKVITAEYANDWRIIERFKREARISKAIRSKHVVRVYEFGESPQGHAFLAMELLSGEELFDRLHRERILSARTVGELSLQILKGLHRIHESGFVHRDIKPENIFFARDAKSGEETVKILDFGIAKRADQKSDPLLSVIGQIYGTPQYLAPEQAVNPDVDHRADLYSLGVVMYECVTGNLPFEADTSYGFIVAHQNDDIPMLPSTVDPEFAEIIYRALHKDPAARFQSALEMGRVIKKWVDDTSWVEAKDPSFSMELEISAIDSSMDDLLSSAKTQVSPPRSESPPSSRNIPAFHREDSSPGIQAAARRTPAPSPRPAVAKTEVYRPPQKKAQAPSTSEALAAPDTSELRNPVGDEPATEKDARTAQIITGVALGVLILALIWALFL